MFQKLLRAITQLKQTEDDTGCSDDLTVVSKLAFENVAELQTKMLYSLQLHPLKVSAYKSGKRIKAVIPVALEALLDCRHIEGLNDLAERSLIDYNDRDNAVLEDLSYRIVGFNHSRTLGNEVHIEVNAKLVRFD